MVGAHHVTLRNGVKHLLTMTDVFALRELEFQTQTLENSLRLVLSEAEARLTLFDPGEPSGPDEELSSQIQFEALYMHVNTSEQVVQATMGVVPVLMHAHVEKWIKRFLSMTNRPNIGHRWPEWYKYFRTIGIDLTALPGYPVANLLRLMSNCYKHDGGVSTQRIDLLDGGSIPPGTEVDFAHFCYMELCAQLVEFLCALASAANDQLLSS